MYHLLEEIEHPTILSLRLLVADSQAIPIMNLTNGPLRILALTNSMILSERDTAMLKIQTKLEVKKHFQSIFVTERRSTLDLRRFAKQLTIEGITELGVGLAGFAEAQGFVLLRLANAIKELVFFARTHHLYASGAHQLQLRTYEESPFRAQLRVQDAYVALLRGPNSAQISALLTELLQTCPNALFEMSEQLIETIHRFDQLHETHFEVQLLSAFL